MCSASNHSERRQYERLELSDAAVAVASDGLELGVVIDASGGGLSLRASSPEALARLQTGSVLRVRVVEGGVREVAAFQACVRSLHDGVAGLEFV